MKANHFPYISVFLLLSVASLSVQAQRAFYKPQVHQVDIQLGSVHQIPALNAYYNGLVVSPNIINGLTYIYHPDLSNAFRLGAGYYSADFYQDNGGHEEVKRRFVAINLGYMAKYHIRKTQLFAGIDGRYHYGQHEKTTLTQTGSETATSMFSAYGLGGYAGGRYFFSPYLSFALEAGIQYMLNPGANSGTDPSIFYEPATELSWQTRATVSFHFKKMDKKCACPRF